MSKDPRDGLKLRLGYEVAREIERTPIIALGVIDQATKAINSVLYQRLQDQIIDDNPTARILEERVRDINITNIASENNINKQDLIAVLQSSGFQGPPGDKGHLETKAIKVLLELRVHLLDHREDQDLDGHRGLVDQGVQFLWMRHPTPPKDLPMIHHRLHHRK